MHSGSQCIRNHNAFGITEHSEAHCIRNHNTYIRDHKHQIQFIANVSGPVRIFYRITIHSESQTSNYNSSPIWRDLEKCYFGWQCIRNHKHQITTMWRSGRSLCRIGPRRVCFYGSLRWDSSSKHVFINKVRNFTMTKFINKVTIFINKVTIFTTTSFYIYYW